MKRGKKVYDPDLDVTIRYFPYYADRYNLIHPWRRAQYKKVRRAQRQELRKMLDQGEGENE